MQFPEKGFVRNDLEFQFTGMDSEELLTAIRRKIKPLFTHSTTLHPWAINLRVIFQENLDLLSQMDEPEIELHTASSSLIPPPEPLDPETMRKAIDKYVEMTKCSEEAATMTLERNPAVQSQILKML